MLNHFGTRGVLTPGRIVGFFCRAQAIIARTNRACTKRVLDGSLGTPFSGTIKEKAWNTRGFGGPPSTGRYFASVLGKAQQRGTSGTRHDFISARPTREMAQRCDLQE